MACLTLHSPSHQLYFIPTVSKMDGSDNAVKKPSESGIPDLYCCFYEYMYNIVKGRGRKGRLYYVEWIFKDKKKGFCSIKSVKG